MTDDLRARIAAAIRADLMKAIPPWEPVPGLKLSPGMGRTEFDLADAAMSVVEAEQREYEETVVGSLNECVTRLARQAAQAEATIARVREFAADSALLPAWVRERLADALDPPPPPRPRCRGRGKIPDWTHELDPIYGEPKAKPCPDCAAEDAPLRTPATPEAAPLPTQATNLSLVPPPEFTVRLSGFEILRNEIAAETDTLDRLRAWLATQDPWAVGCVTSLFRLAADPGLPVGEVHMRPAKAAPADVAGPATQASGPQFTGGPVEMPTVDYTGQKWWRGKPWPPRDETSGCER